MSSTVPRPDPAAVEAVQLERLRVDARREDDERAMCRLWLQANVVSISSLAADVALERGIDLREACHAIVPEMALRWRSVRSSRMFHPGFAKSRAGKGASRGWDLDAALARRASRRGALFGDVFSTEGWSGFAVGPSTLEAVGRIGVSWFGTSAGRGWLTLPVGIPETLAVSLPGRQLDAVFSHGALDGRGYRVSSVQDLGGGLRAAVFRTGVRPFEMPWPDLLAELFAA